MRNFLTPKIWIFFYSPLEPLHWVSLADADRRSTPISTILPKSIRFFIIDGLMFNDKRYFSKFQAWHQYGIPCEQLFLSCMAISVYEVVHVAAWLVCGVVGLFTRGVNKSTTRLTCDLVFLYPFCFGDEGKSKKKKTPDCRLKELCHEIQPN